MKLYRIISLETFLDIIVNKRERYVRPATWEDTFEGYLFSKLKNSADRKRIVEYWYHEVCSNNCQNVIINMMHLDSSKYVYGQCWSELSESDALWRIYSYGNHSIQIQTSKEDLEKLLTERNIKGTIRKIEYDITSEKDLLEKQLLQSAQEGYAYAPFLHNKHNTINPNNIKNCLNVIVPLFSMFSFNTYAIKIPIIPIVNASIEYDAPNIIAIGNKYEQ